MYKLKIKGTKWMPAESTILKTKAEILKTGEEWKKSGVDPNKIMVYQQLKGCDSFIAWRLYEDFVNIEVNDIQNKIPKKDVLKGVAYAIWSQNEADEWAIEIKKVSLYLAYGVDMNEDIIKETISKVIDQLEKGENV